MTHQEKEWNKGFFFMMENVTTSIKKFVCCEEEMKLVVRYFIAKFFTVCGWTKELYLNSCKNLIEITWTVK